jgi:hypothetical protein
MGVVTYIPFQPTNSAPFAFSPELDGNIYNATVTWLLYGARWYLNLYDVNGNWIFTEGLVPSPPGIPIQAATWAGGSVTITTTVPHGYRPGAIISLTVAGMSPDAYNGRWSMMATGVATLRFALSANPGVATAYGALSYDVDLVGGYFTTSTLVFRDGTSQFEVTNPIPGSAAAAALAAGASAPGIFILGQSILGGGDVLG